MAGCFVSIFWAQSLDNDVSSIDEKGASIALELHESPNHKGNFDGDYCFFCILDAVAPLIGKNADQNEYYQGQLEVDRSDLLDSINEKLTDVDEAEEEVQRLQKVYDGLPGA